MVELYCEVTIGYDPKLAGVGVGERGPEVQEHIENEDHLIRNRTDVVAVVCLGLKGQAIGHRDLGFGRIVVSEKEVPNMLVNLV